MAAPAPEMRFGDTSHIFTTAEKVGIGIGGAAFVVASVVGVYYFLVCIRGMRKRRQQPDVVDVELTAPVLAAAAAAPPSLLGPPRPAATAPPALAAAAAAPRPSGSSLSGSNSARTDDSMRMFSGSGTAPHARSSPSGSDSARTDDSMRTFIVHSGAASSPADDDSTSSGALEFPGGFVVLPR